MKKKKKTHTTTARTQQQTAGAKPPNPPHPHHLCDIVLEVDPIEATKHQPVRLLWLSPDCKHFSKAGIKTNVTLCFSATQALLAAKAGATYVSPFVGRLDDINLRGMDLIEELVAIFENYGLETQVLAASIRLPRHVTEAALAGAHVATIPTKVFDQMVQHPLTDKGVAQFMADWKKSGR